MISSCFSQNSLNLIKFKQQPIPEQSLKPQIPLFSPRKHKEKFTLDQGETIHNQNQPHFLSSLQPCIENHTQSSLGAKNQLHMRPNNNLHTQFKLDHPPPKKKKKKNKRELLKIET